MTDASIASNVALRHFHNEFSEFLNDPQYRIGMFIYMRTVPFDKLTAKISVKQICEGVWSKPKQEWATAGCNKKPSAVREHLARMESLGILTRLPTPGGFTEYGINFATFADTIRERLKALEEGRNPSRIPDTPLQNSGPPPLQNSGYPTKTSNIKTSILKDAPEARDPTGSETMPNKAMDAATAVLDATRTKSREARQVRKSKGGEEALWKTWVDALHEHFPGIEPVVWTQAQRHLIKTKLLPPLKDHDPCAFLEYAVGNWNAIFRDKLTTLPSKPQTPTIKSVYTFIHEFREAYLEHIGVITRHRPAANVRRDTRELDELKRVNEALVAERDKAAQAAAASRNEHLAQLGRGTPKAPVRRIVKPLKPRPATGTAADNLPEWD
jgi:hypothetical protein